MQTTMVQNSSQQKALILKISIFRDFIQNAYIIYTYLFIYLFACVAGGIVCEGNALATSGVTALPNSIPFAAPPLKLRENNSAGYAGYLTIILRNRAEYHLILSRRGRRPSWLNQGIFRKIEQDNCFIIQQIPIDYHFQNEKSYGSMMKTLKASNT